MIGSIQKKLGKKELHIQSLIRFLERLSPFFYCYFQLSFLWSLYSIVYLDFINDIMYIRFPPTKEAGITVKKNPVLKYTAVIDNITPKINIGREWVIL